jgi:hypothetical protein
VRMLSFAWLSIGSNKGVGEVRLMRVNFGRGCLEDLDTAFVQAWYLMTA